MSTLAADPTSLTALPIAVPADRAVRERVWALLSNLYPVAPYANRRSEQRYPFACLAKVTPVQGEDLAAAGPPIVAATKNISESGISFFHAVGMPYRRVIIQFERDEVSTIRFLADLSWCRFTRYGWYESGGRLLQVIDDRPELDAT